MHGDKPYVQAMLQAAGRHEEAVGVYSQILQHRHQPDRAALVGAADPGFLVVRCCEAYAAVADWQGLQHWLQDLKVTCYTALEPLSVHSCCDTAV